MPILDSMWWLSKNEVKVGVAFITIGKALNSNDRWKAKCSVCQEYITALHSIQLLQMQYRNTLQHYTQLNCFKCNTGIHYSITLYTFASNIVHIVQEYITVLKSK